MDTTEIVIIAIAVYGAGLSTVLGIREWRRSRPSLHVTAKHGYVIDDNGEYSEPVLVLNAANVGSGSAFLVSTGFMNKDGTKLAVTTPYPSGIVPAELKEKQSLTSPYACRWLRVFSAPEEIVAVYFHDQTGKYWVGRLDRGEKAFCLASVGDGWLLETRQPRKPMVLITKKPSA